MKYRSHIALIIVLVILALVGSVTVTGRSSSSKTIRSPGTVKINKNDKDINFKVYLDLECTQVLDHIDWGSLEPGQSADKMIYIKNMGNTELSLAMTYSGWVPLEAGNYITLSWNKDGATVTPGETIEAILTLTVSSSTSGITSFSFDIFIEGSSRGPVR